MVLAAVDLDEAVVEYDCKAPNCTGKARSSRGQHAYLCPVHIAAKLPPRRQATPAVAGGDLVAATKVLQPLARKLQQTMPGVHHKRATARQAAAQANAASTAAATLVAEFNDALAQVRRAAEALVKEAP